jgi:bifunctional non-homologous end joining protein LigD
MKNFNPVVDVLKKWDINAVIDGEVVVLNEKGISNFGSLQNWRSEADGSLFYYVFDIIWLNGYDLKSLLLTKRRQILKDILPNENMIRLSENFETTATEFLATASKMGMEGIMAKKEDSVYVEGDRTREWLKIKSNKRHEVVIGGFTQNEGSVKTFSSLLVGVFDNGRLDYIGKIGTGFNDKNTEGHNGKDEKTGDKKNPFY